ncbi:NAD-P-binding protein [Trametes gibbosa]|nr:NAD-P-binding protein [Trametes gibbosa]
MPSYYAVVGASRGIGLEFVRQLAARGPDTEVFAIVRDANAPHLKHVAQSHRNVHIVPGDVVDHRSLQHAAEDIAALTGGSLDVLVHTAARMNSALNKAIDEYQDLDELDTDFVESVRLHRCSCPTPFSSSSQFSQFKVNALGMVHSITAFLPLLRRGPTKKIVLLNTEGASPSLTVRAGSADVAAYCTSKAAAAMVAAKYAARLGAEGFVVVSLCPGVVDTERTAVDPVPAGLSKREVVDRMNAAGHRVELLTPAQSVEAQLGILAGLDTKRNGAFLTYTGETIGL